MIGIYKYENKNNHKIYIGQSLDIQRRRYQHKSSTYNKEAKDYNSKFHQAIREEKNGFEDFSFEIIAELNPEEYSQEILDELEKFFIKYYNSYKEGYNSTEGGTAIPYNSQKGEKNGRALLTKNDVEYIRECYNAHIPFRIVYEKYKNQISKRGLQKIWWFDTWKDIHPEYHTEENKYWHSHQAKANSSEIAAQNKRKFTKEQVIEMREAYKNGLTPKQIRLKYAPNVAWSTVYNIITYKSYQNIE